MAATRAAIFLNSEAGAYIRTITVVPTFTRS
jgi:hypothetical protein